MSSSCFLKLVVIVIVSILVGPPVYKLYKDYRTLDVHTETSIKANAGGLIAYERKYEDGKITKDNISTSARVAIPLRVVDISARKEVNVERVESEKSALVSPDTFQSLKSGNRAKLFQGLKLESSTVYSAKNRFCELQPFLLQRQPSQKRISNSRPTFLWSSL